ncbi:hypothetical protein Avbf_04741 [Armadillidium vulgare]|nr:hypothetical protein Avbf_04741 [Armadillidium vulgare]
MNALEQRACEEHLIKGKSLPGRAELCVLRSSIVTDILCPSVEIVGFKLISAQFDEYGFTIQS